MVAEQKRERGRLDADGVRRIVQVVSFGLVICAALVIIAGRWDWGAGWAFSAMFLGYFIVLMVYSLRHDPEILNERGRAVSAASTPTWEKVLVWGVGILQLAMIGLSALDAGRYGWSVMPPVVQAVGWLVLVAAAVMTGWVFVTNTFASVVVRVQEERGHHVVDIGPYRYVRHPMYVGVILFGLGTPLALGSWVGLVPGVLLGLVFIGRTVQEDRKLQRELPGYVDYTHHTRYRLLPGLW